MARAVAFVVTYGLAHRQMDGINAIGVDEIHVQKNLFLTLVYQLDSPNPKSPTDSAEEPKNSALRC